MGPAGASEASCEGSAPAFAVAFPPASEASSAAKKAAAARGG